MFLGAKDSICLISLGESKGGLTELAHSWLEDYRATSPSSHTNRAATSDPVAPLQKARGLPSRSRQFTVCDLDGP